jgi:hypothetical protein
MFCKAIAGTTGGGRHAPLLLGGGLCGAAGFGGTTMRRTKGQYTRAGGLIRAIPEPGGAVRDG